MLSCSKPTLADSPQPISPNCSQILTRRGRETGRRERGFYLWIVGFESISPANPKAFRYLDSRALGARFCRSQSQIIGVPKFMISV